MDPPEKKDEPIKETITLKSTLGCLMQTLNNRERQIASLKSQLETCKSMYADGCKEAEHVAVGLRSLQANPSLLHKAFEDSVQRRRVRVRDLASNLRKTRQQGEYYHELANQQRLFLLQSARIAVIGKEAFNRHRAGEIAVVLQPPPMGDDRPEAWDVGSAIANPYVCDSWPFEPNCLARRSPQDAPMQPFTEETKEELEDSDDSDDGLADAGPGRRSGHPGFNLNLGGRLLYNNDYEGPSDTARSL